MPQVQPHERLVLFSEALLRALRLAHAKSPLSADVVAAAAHVKTATAEMREDSAFEATARDLVARQGVRIRELEALLREEVSAAIGKADECEELRRQMLGLPTKGLRREPTPRNAIHEELPPGVQHVADILRDIPLPGKN